jgi:3-methyladenine DNA glycosylase AlkD
MDLHRELRKRVKKGKAKLLQGYFREKMPFLGVMVPQVREIAKGYYREDKERKPNEVYKTVTGLMNGRYHEEKNLALFILQQYNKHFDVVPFCEKHLSWFDNWDLTDMIGAGTIGKKALRDKRMIKKFYTWAKSNNLWTRRLAAVSTLPLIKEKNIEPAMKIARMLAKDREYMVQKGYAWTLKEAAVIDTKRVVKFLKDHNSPRLVVNIAKEKMPERVKRTV